MSLATIDRQNPLLSICVCTRDRATLLNRALESLLPELDADRVEILVIDNGSRDATSGVVDSFASRSRAIRYASEPIAGLSNARNRGWRESTGLYVGYIDDDAVARPGWLSAALEIATTTHPEAFGGPYFAYYDSPKPAWYRDEYYSHSQGDVARDLREDEYLDGTNLFVRRDLLVRLGGFDSRLGMQGRAPSYGEETDFLDRLRRASTGAAIRYDPRLAVDHLVPAYKMRFGWIARSALAEGRVNHILFEKRCPTGWRLRAGRAIASLLADFTVGLVVRDRGRYPLLGGYLYERTLDRFREIGAALEQGGNQSPRT